MAQETGSYLGDIFGTEDVQQTLPPGWMYFGDPSGSNLSLGLSDTGGDIVSLPPYVVTDTSLGQGSVFDINPPTGAGGSGVIPSTSDALYGSGFNVNSLVGMPTVSTRPVATPLEGNDIYTQIYNQELARRNSIRQSKGELPIAAYDTAEINQLADWAKNQVGIVSQQQDAASALAARNAASGQTGIPAVFPLPVDPVTGLIITAAGLIGSGGQIAKIDPSNPVGSTIGAATGTISSIGNIPSQIGSIFSGPTAAGAPAAGEGVTTVSPIVVGAGALGGQSSSGANSTVTPGSLGGQISGVDTPTGTTVFGGTPAVVGTGTQQVVNQISPEQQQTILGQVLGGVGAAGTQIATQAQQASQAEAEAAARQSVLAGMANVGKGSTPSVGGDTGAGGGGGSTVIGGGGGAGGGGTPTDTKIGGGGSGTTIGGGGASSGGAGAGGGDTGGGGTGTTIGGSGAGGGGGAGTGTGLYYGTQTSTYKPMATTPAQRNLQYELSQSAPALFGTVPTIDASGKPTGGSYNIMDQYSNLYQNLLGQTMLGNTLTGEGAKPGLTSQIGQQLAADQAKLQRIQQGQLGAEDVRNAQQAAREAYAARGQVMGQGAIGAEILNREAIRQQRENEARAAYQASMQNAFNATQLQTGNIFQPIGSLVSNTFNPLAAYEADVYGTNVNAINAAQIAEANRAAALEAAKLGQTGTYAQAFGSFLGSPTGLSFLKSLGLG